MITETVLSAYRELDGNLDGIGRWWRSDDAGLERSLYQLAELVQRASLVTRGLTDAEFAEGIRREVEQATASSEIAAKLWELAASGGRGADHHDAD
jgi:hypothetical protein